MINNTAKQIIENDKNLSSEEKVKNLLKIIKSDDAVLDSKTLRTLIDLFLKNKEFRDEYYLTELFSIIFIFITWNQKNNFSALQIIIDELMSLPAWDPDGDILYAFISSEKYKNLYEPNELLPSHT